YPDSGGSASLREYFFRFLTFGALLSGENHGHNNWREGSRTTARFEFRDTQQHCRPGVGRDPGRNAARHARICLDSGLRRSDECGYPIFPGQQCTFASLACLARVTLLFPHRSPDRPLRRCSPGMPLGTPSTLDPRLRSCPPRAAHGFHAAIPPDRRAVLARAAPRWRSLSSPRSGASMPTREAASPSAQQGVRTLDELARARPFVRADRCARRLSSPELAPRVNRPLRCAPLQPLCALRTHRSAAVARPLVPRLAAACVRVIRSSPVRVPPCSNPVPRVQASARHEARRVAARHSTPLLASVPQERQMTRPVRVRRSLGLAPASARAVRFP